MAENNSAQEYWRANIRLCVILLCIWALVSFIFGILLQPALDQMVKIGGVGLGFWFAQQGSMLVFVVLIFVYAWRMNALDRKFDVNE